MGNTYYQKLWIIIIRRIIIKILKHTPQIWVSYDWKKSSSSFHHTTTQKRKLQGMILFLVLSTKKIWRTTFCSNLQYQEMRHTPKICNFLLVFNMIETDIFTFFIGFMKLQRNKVLTIKCLPDLLMNNYMRNYKEGTLFLFEKFWISLPK